MIRNLLANELLYQGQTYITDSTESSLVDLLSRKGENRGYFDHYIGQHFSLVEVVGISG